jgi:S1-C subfamily serine protease
VAVRAQQPVPPIPDDEGDQPGGVRQGKLGIQGQTVTPDMAQRMKLKTQSGVLVMGVQRGSPASEAGIDHGDVIHRIGRTEVNTIEELVIALDAIKSGEVVLEIERGGRTSFVTVRLD